MDAINNGPRDQAFPSLGDAGHGRSLRALLERAEASFRSSAARLRIAGTPELARLAEQFAQWTRFDLAEADGLLPSDLRAGPEFGGLLDAVLDVALELLHADRGNIQVADPATGALRIAAQRGFGAEFLDYFAVVTDEGSACGRAAYRRAPVMITDVTTDPGYAPHREIAAASGFRAVQSTPLVNRNGRLVGVLSTHYPRPTTLPAHDLQTIGQIGTLTGERLSRLLSGAQVH